MVCTIVVGTLLLMLATVEEIAGSDTVSINIDAEKGHDSKECYMNSSCKTLSYAVNRTGSYSNVTYKLLSKSVQVHNVLVFHNRNGISIVSDVSTNLECSCNNNDSCGLRFNNCYDTTISGINIIRCSVLQNFSKKSIHKQSTAQYRSGIIFENSTKIKITHSSVSESLGYGAFLLNSHESILIDTSAFINNTITRSAAHPHASLDKVHGGGGLYLIASYCSPFATHCSSTNITGNYVIRNCSFTANAHNKTTHPMQWTISFGGGMSIFLRWNASNNNISIDNSTFANNVAVGGGGLSIMLRDTASNNKITITRCTFIGNRVKDQGTNGGGMILGMVGHEHVPQANTITFTNCSITNNRACRFGGGTSMFFAYYNEDISVNNVTFSNCTWQGNIAPISAAVDVAPSLTGQTEPTFLCQPNFHNCDFLENKAVPYAFLHEATLHQGIGAFLINKLKVYFSGEIHFTSNNNTALYLDSAVASICNYSKLCFHNNTGTKGGAIYLNGFSSIEYNSSTYFEFSNNTAKMQGGAIYISRSDQHLTFASHSCFLQHELKEYNNTHELNNTFHFNNNSALSEYGHSIFLTASHPCQLACSENNDTVLQPYETFDDSCLGTFFFNDMKANDTGRIELASEPSKLIYNSTTLDVIPGFSSSIKIRAYDDFHNDVTIITVYIADVINGNKSVNNVLDPATVYINSNYVIIHGYEGHDHDPLLLSLTAVGNRKAFIHIPLNLRSCPPGYVKVGVTKSQTQNKEDQFVSCQCSAVLNSSYYYEGIMSCNDTNINTHTILTRPGIWLGYITENNAKLQTEDNLYTILKCPHGYCKTSLTYTRWINNMVPYSSCDITSSAICTKNREGTLCGKCKKNTSVYYNSCTYECKKNRYCKYGILLYILTELLPIVILFSVVIYYDISLTNGAAYSIVFVLQQMRALTVIGDDTSQSMSFQYSALKAVRMIYNILNLEFMPPFCIFEDATALDIVAIKYGSVVFAMFLVIALAYFMNHCCSSHLIAKIRCQQEYLHFPHYSIVQGMVALIVICYFQLTSITFEILNRQIPYGKGGKAYSHSVVYLDGRMQYLVGKHWYYAVPAFVCLFTVVIPLPLLLLLDPISMRIEDRVKWCYYKQPWTKVRKHIKPLMDVFQGCFKDHLRCYAGFFFLYRTLILSINAFLPTRTVYIHTLQGLLIIILVKLALLQPFQKRAHNNISIFAIGYLASLNLLTICMVQTSLSESMNELEWIQTALYCLPLFFGIAWCMWRAYAFCRDRLSCCKKYAHYDTNSFTESLFQREPITSTTTYGAITTDDEHQLTERVNLVLL